MSINNDIGSLAAALDYEPKCECGEQRYCGTPKACGALFRLADENRKRLAEGTDSRRYNPLPGDLVSVDCKGISPKYDQHGTRLGTVITVGSDGDVEVKLPGWNHGLYLKPGWLELVRRAS